MKNTKSINIEDNLYKILENATICKIPFPINELKQQLNKINMELIERLKNLRDKNPDLKEVLEKQFPEIVDKKPFVYSSAIFMKKQYPTNLYILLFIEGYFIIRNIKENKNWVFNSRPTNYEIDSFEEYYLSKQDFNKLLKASGTSINNIELVKTSSLEFMHTNLFLTTNTNNT